LLAINGVLSAAGLILLVFAHSFWQFAIAIVLAGIGKAFASGSENALLYDSLLQENKQADFEKLLGRLSAVDFTGSIIAALSGGVLANLFGYEFNYYISVASMLLAFFVILSLKEPPMLTKSENETSGFLQHAKQALSLFKLKPLVLLYCLTGAVLGGCLIYLDEFWQIILDNIGIPVLFFGLVGAIESIIRMPGNLFAYKLKGKFRYKHIMWFIILINIVGYISIFFTRSILCLVPMILVSLAAGITEPLIAGYLHHNTESHIRATVESFSSLGLRVVSVGIGLLFGYISTGYSIFAGFLTLGLICFAYLFVFMVFSKKATPPLRQPE